MMERAGMMYEDFRELVKQTVVKEVHRLTNQETYCSKCTEVRLGVNLNLCKVYTAMLCMKHLNEFEIEVRGWEEYAKVLLWRGILADEPAPEHVQIVLSAEIDLALAIKKWLEQVGQP